MDAIDHDLHRVFQQALKSYQPPADARERLLQAASQIHRSSFQASDQSGREVMEPNNLSRSDEPVKPLVRMPLLNAEKGWG